MTAQGSMNGRQFSPYIPAARMAEIRNAMPPVYIGNSRNPADPTTSSTGKRGRDAMLTQHRITRIIAASDVPAAHLHGIDFIKTGQRLSPGTHAQYETYARMNAPGSIRIASRLSNTRQDGAGFPLRDYHEPRAVRDVRQRVLVHEIGHHQDDRKHELNTSPGIAMAEARAENYADVHLGATKTTPEAMYDDPRNRALSPLQLKAYAQARVRITDDSAS